MTTLSTSERPPLVQRLTLVDPELQAEFVRVGYVRLPLLDDTQVEALRAIYEDIFPEAMSGFVPTYAVPMPDRKAEATKRVKELMSPIVDPIFDDHRAFNSSFLMKWPDDESALPLHQDTCYVDERVFRSAVVWVALDDADEELDNGPLQVIDSSHHFDKLPRGTHTWWPYGGVTDFIGDHCLKSLPVRRGDVLIMDNGLVHCSFPNHSDRPRLAVALAMAPSEAGLIHAVGNDDGTVSIHDVDESFFVEQTPYTLMDDGMPEGYPIREVAPVPPLSFTEADLAEWCGLSDGTAGSPAVESPVTAEAAGVVEERDDGRVPAEQAQAAQEPPSDEVQAEEQGPSRLERAVGMVMRVNNRLIRRAVELVPVLDPADFAWTVPLEAHWREIRAEAQAVLESRTIPRIEEVVGRSQGNVGDWSTFVLEAQRQVIASNAALCPITARLLEDVPGLQSALLSVFASGTHLPAHRAPNRGVLRYHLGLIVPEPSGTCRLRVVDQMLNYAEGESLLFDDTFEHEAWNDADEARVTLLLEVVRPLPQGYRQANAITQRAFGLYPEARGAADRLEQLEWVLNGDRSGATRS